jgi:hypothetical protein
MRKIILALLLICLLSTVSSAGQWRAGSGENTVLETTLINDLDSVTYGYIVDPLDRLLAKYRKGVAVQYNSASQLTVTSGEVTVSNSAGTIRLFLSNAASTTVTWSNIDAGSEASSTTYYVYATASSASDTTITFKISTSTTSPSGVTYYAKLGSFYNDASSNITLIDDNNNVDMGDWSSKTVGSTYQAATDGFVVFSASASNDGGDSVSYTCYSDSSSTPTTVRQVTAAGFYDGDYNYGSLTVPVKKGDYYKVSNSILIGDGGGITTYLFFVPLNNT